MPENRASWIFLIVAVLAVAWGVHLKLSQPKAPEKEARWVKMDGKLTNYDTRELFQGVRKIDFNLTPGVVQYEWEYADGLQHGTATEFYSGFGNLVKERWQYVKGVAQGPMETFHQNGAKASSGTAVAGELSGMVTYFSEDGMVAERAVFEDGVRTDAEAVTQVPVLEEEPLPEEVDVDDLPEWDLSQEDPPPPLMLDADGKPFTGTQMGTFHGGAKAFEHEYLDGKRIGTHRGWHENGEPEYERGYADGEPHGEWKTWSQGGQLLREETFSHGQQIGAARSWGAGGQLRSEAQFVHGAEDGERTEYDRRGRKRRVTRFDHGREIGITEFAADGSINLEESRPLPTGVTLMVAASEEEIIESAELPEVLEDDAGRRALILRYRLSTNDPQPPKDLVRAFRITILQGEKETAFDELEVASGGWVENEWMLNLSAGETVSVQIKARPGDLQIDLAGIRISE